MGGGAAFCVAPLTWQDGLARYPPAASQEWNTVVLQPGDYDEDFYTIISNLEQRHLLHEFSEADFDHLGLTFNLVTAQGTQYNLIPNGSEIRVTRSNAYEYFQRVRSAYEGLRQSTAMHSPAPPPLPPATRATALSPPQPRLRSTATGLRLTVQDIPSLERLRWSARNDPERLIFPPGEKLRWAVVPRTNDFMIRLRPDGEFRVVDPDDLPLFLDAVVTTMNEAERAIENFGYYPPSIICAVPAELTGAAPATRCQGPSTHASPTPVPQRRDSGSSRTSLYASVRAASAAAAKAAVATGQERRYIPSASPAELEKQRALFSPMHGTGNILAPFQEINM
ncbi:hypothetical protein ABB37_03502 [Leptomonas pyrrhocoris]|uniref:HECT domain-containing protein n=1 Tax=Leptomonas pyrrhocoris TaxID=157538 RepID=A0A0N0VG07_LEPPY|nr:hypothetical protein ABB37_03502 [Leptomonas pyrrhocoris]KPA82434.1 hypothetical protein ABB37_03502 [Leptomonas pyrrhocoris]|eukprot:XP_015660873.1 hypothetical protein ABB37_03502 [Leptomonas pyrrhocoris]